MKSVGRWTDSVVCQYAESIREDLGPVGPGMTQACLAGQTAIALVTGWKTGIINLKSC